MKNKYFLIIEYNKKIERINFMENIFTARNIIIYLIIINLIGFLIMYIDKQKAKKGNWRIPEKTIFLVTLLGGGIGTISGMYAFRHKTKHLKFTIGIPITILINIICIYYIFKYLIL